MLKYRAAVNICLLALAWQALVCLGSGSHSKKALHLWQQGQDAMSQSRPDRAIGYYEESLRLDPTFTKNHMSLAAALLEKSENAKACAHLARYLDSHPDHYSVRRHYADLLFGLNRVGLAKLEFTRFLLQTEDRKEASPIDRIHCHRRLMEIAILNDDVYRIHLHKGISIYLLALERSRFPDPNGQLPVEGLLFKSASSLAIAHLTDAARARPCWYLHLVWSKLGQSNLANRYLCEAQQLAMFNDLTPGEYQELMFIFLNQSQDLLDGAT